MSDAGALAPMIGLTMLARRPEVSWCKPSRFSRHLDSDRLPFDGSGKVAMVRMGSGLSATSGGWLPHIVAAAAVLVSLTACGASLEQPATPTAGNTSTPTGLSAPAPSASSVLPSDPVLRPELGAKQNLAYFDFVNRRTLAVNPNADGKAFIDGLIAAGFAKADLQVTADRTSANLPSDSIQFSVRLNGSCLIGQNGKGSLGYHSIATALLATGNCLIGNTRSINW